MRYILRALKADEEVMTKSHGRILRKMRLPLLKKQQRIWKENRKASYQFLQMYQRRSYQSKLVRLTKFPASLKHTKTNELFYTGPVVVTNRSGVKINNAAEKKKPLWRRLQNKIKELRKDLKADSKV